MSFIPTDRDLASIKHARACLWLEDHGWVRQPRPPHARLITYLRGKGRVDIPLPESQIVHRWRVALDDIAAAGGLPGDALWVVLRSWQDRPIFRFRAARDDAAAHQG